MPQPGTDPWEGRQETEKERVDRNLLELTGELRVALPGVQVLFAFLLVVPFNARFLEVTDFQQAVYLVTLLLTAASSAFLIAPTVHHRLTFRQQQKERIVLVGNRLTIVGLTTLGLAMTGVVLLVTDFVFGTVATVVGAGLTAALFAVVWYVVPLRRQV
jgi:Family of unknown function (DUF6328)